MPEQHDSEPSAAQRDAGESGDGSSGGFFPLRNRQFTADNLLAPLAVGVAGTLLTLGLTGGLGWLGSLGEEEEPPLYVSGSRSALPPASPEPSAGERTRPGQAPSPPADREERQEGREGQERGASPRTRTGATGTDGGGSAPAAGEPSATGRPPAAKPDVGHQRYHSYRGCTWDAWVVDTPPHKLKRPPVRDGRPRLSYAEAADPDRTVVTLNIQPRDARALIVEGCG